MAKTRANALRGRALAAVALLYPDTTPATTPPSRLPPYTPEQLAAFLNQPAPPAHTEPKQLTMFATGVDHALTT